MSRALTSIIICLAFLFNASIAHADKFEDALRAVEKANTPLDAARKAIGIINNSADWQKSIVYSAIGWKYNNAGAFDEAISYFEHGCDFSKNHCDDVGRAIALYNANQYYSSLRIANKWLEYEKRSPTLEFRQSFNYIAGINYYAMGQKEKACQHWDESYRAGAKHSQYSASAGEKLRRYCK